MSSGFRPRSPAALALQFLAGKDAVGPAAALVVRRLETVPATWMFDGARPAATAAAWEAILAGLMTDADAPLSPM